MKEQERLAAIDARINEILEERELYLNLGNELSRNPAANRIEIENAMSSAIDLMHSLIAARNEKVTILEERECTTLEEISQKSHDILEVNREAKNDFEVLMDPSKPFSIDLFEIFEEDYRIDNTYNFTIARVNTQTVDQVLAKQTEIPRRQEKLLRESEDLQKRLKGHDTLMDEFEKFYEDFLKRHEADTIDVESVRIDLAKRERHREVLLRTRELQVGTPAYDRTQALFLANEKALEADYTKLYVKNMQGLFDRGASNYKQLLEIVTLISQTARDRTRQYVDSGLREASVIKDFKLELQGFLAIEAKVKSQINYRQRLRDYQKQLSILEKQKARLQLEEANILGIEATIPEEEVTVQQVPTPKEEPTVVATNAPKQAPKPTRTTPPPMKEVPRARATTPIKPVPRALSPEVKKVEQGLNTSERERSKVTAVRAPKKGIISKAGTLLKAIGKLQKRIISLAIAGIMMFSMASCGAKVDTNTGDMTFTTELPPPSITMTQREEEAPPKEEVQSAIGDLIRFNGNTLYHASAQKLGPTGTVGQHIASPQEGIYQITGISIMDANNNYVKVGYQEGVTAEDLARQAGIDLSTGNYTVMNHFNFYKANSEANIYENVKEALRGWTLDDGNYEIVGKSDQHFVIDAIKNLSNKVDSENKVTNTTTPDRDTGSDYDRDDDYDNDGPNYDNNGSDHNPDDDYDVPGFDNESRPSIPGVVIPAPGDKDDNDKIDDPIFTPSEDETQAVIKETTTPDGNKVTGEYIGTTQDGDEFHATVDENGNPVYTDKDGQEIPKPDGINAEIDKNGDVSFTIDESLQEAAEKKTDEIIDAAEEEKADELGKDQADLTEEERADAFGDALENPVGGIYYSPEDIEKMKEDYEQSLREEAIRIVDAMEMDQTPSQENAPTK